jgi:hypothetical protein
VATANQIQKKVKFDDAVERLFEEGEAIWVRLWKQQS